MKNHPNLMFLAAILLCGSGAAADRAPRGPDFEAHSVHRDVKRDAATSDARDALLPVDTIHFAFDSARMDRVDRIEVLDAARWVETHPGYHLVVEGYADASGAKDYNRDLSARRARAVRRQIVAAGVPRDRVVAVVYGENKPQGGPAALDRRVVIYATQMTTREIVETARPFGYAVLWS
jgi:outer membrane protein OmpA-like peptidoglycan-associated protein